MAALTVYFDGSCPVCSREIAMYRRRPGAESCEWVDAAACPDAALGSDLSRPTALARFHVRRADGTLVSGMRGFALLWQALPATAWLGRLAAMGPMPAVLDAAYRVFLVLRRSWRAHSAVPGSPAPTSPSAVPWPSGVLADLRSDHAGETGAVQIYRGVLAVSRDPALREFAQHHLETELSHLDILAPHLPATHRSRLLPAWRWAGWLTGALPALAGPRAVYATVAAVETFVDLHYRGQIDRLDALPPDPRCAALRADLERCRLDEVQHRAEALQAGPATGLVVRLWTGVVTSGSAAAVSLARRI
jgi:demethoxyubiquinone hydroxylase (CLK1/Coq7/Cat5 family)